MKRGDESLLIEFNNVSSGSFTKSSFSLCRGESVFLKVSGSNSAIRLLRLITGILSADSGEIRICGEPLNTSSAPGLRKKMGFISFHGGLISNLKVIENVMLLSGFIKGLSRREAYRAASEALDESGYCGDRMALPATLSACEYRIVSSAQAMAAAPEIVVLADPFSGLDTQERSRLYSSIEKIINKQPSILTVIIGSAPKDYEMMTSSIIEIQG